MNRRSLISKQYDYELDIPHTPANISERRLPTLENIFLSMTHITGYFNYSVNTLLFHK